MTLRALIEAATPTPWTVKDDPDTDVWWLDKRIDGASFDKTVAYTHNDSSDGDAALIVYLVNHASAIADLIDAARAENMPTARVRAALAALTEPTEPSR